MNPLNYRFYSNQASHIINSINEKNPEQIAKKIENLIEKTLNDPLFLQKDAFIKGFLTQVQNKYTTEDCADLPKPIKTILTTYKAPISITKEEFIQTLEEWVEEAPPSLRNSYKQAKQQIIAFLDNPSQTSLDMRLSQIQTLPNVFDYPDFGNRLLRLDLSQAKITELPVTIGNLTALQTLYLYSTPITHLPETFGNLRALTDLNLHNTPINHLPETFDNLIALQTLDLHNTPITHLPETFSNFRALRFLYLQNTPITHLPEIFSNLIALNVLHLQNTPITSLPNNILTLPRTCTINLEQTPLSDHILGNLQATRSALNYQGPRIRFSMAHHNFNTQNTLTTPALLEKLYQELGELLQKNLTPPPFKEELLNHSDIRNWLAKLCEMADHRAGGAIRLGLLQNVASILEEAHKNPSFLDTFLSCLARVGVDTTCGDGICLSVLYLGLEKKIVEEKNLQKLAHLLLKGNYALELLSQVAKEKVKSLRFVDEIEVYLAYPIKLKKDLQIPIDVENMLFFTISGVTNEDLLIAKKFVEEHLNNPDSCCDFLIMEDAWRKALERSCPEKYEQAVNLDDGGQTLKNLTKEILGLDQSKSLEKES